jgi:hypothetical protein
MEVGDWREARRAILKGEGAPRFSPFETQALPAPQDEDGEALKLRPLFKNRDDRAGEAF